jgi:tetratricopeptide (TPR) repeat protein
VGEAKALSNAARAALDAGEQKRALDLLQRADALARLLAVTRDKAYVLIHVAKSFERLAAVFPEQKEKSLLAANGALRGALELAQEIGDQRSLSYALGNLGALYQSENRVEEALYLTRQALRAAEGADAPESIYRWHWQAGQLLWAQGKASEAIRSYRRAVDILEETRQETLAHYGSAEVYFRQLVAPVYLDLVDALLQGSGMVAEAEQSERLLVEARATVDQLKAAELRDYFRDECVDAIQAGR